MNNKKFGIILAMLVLAIFAVGSVSAADNVTADIEVPTEDIAVDDVSVEDVNENDNVIKEEQNLRGPTYNVNSSMSSATINGWINTASVNGGDVVFANETYNSIAITLKSNVNLIGNGARLVGDGVNTVINIANNCNNSTISGFIIDANYISPANNISAIRGSFVTNCEIYNNTIYNGYNGININKYYDNITVRDNTIYGMINDAVSFANPSTNSNINTLGKTYITNNTLYSSGYGIFVGGNFKGVIANNTISSCTYGMEFKGKPKDGNGVLNATLFNNTISYCNYGINMFHPNVAYLYLDHMIFDYINVYDIYTNSAFGTYTYIGVYNSVFYMGVTYPFYNAVGLNKGNNTYFSYYP